MTEERKKLSLKKTGDSPADAATEARRKPPLRGPGTAPRVRMSAAEAAKAREEAASRPQEERQQDRPQAHRQEHRQERQPERMGDARHRGPSERAQADRPRRSDAAAPRGKPAPAPNTRSDEPRARPSPKASLSWANKPPTKAAAESRERQAPPRMPSPPATPPAEPREDDGRIRLSKLMSERGLASRREADEWIEQGWVRVDGVVVDELGTRIHPDQSISIDPMARTQQAQRVTILIHKPMGYVSGQAEDGYEPAIALVTHDNRWKDDKLPIQLTRGHLRNLAPAGRLDIDSTGLLVLTQDGRVAKQLIGEDSGIEKEYLVRVQAMSQPDAENVAAIVPPEVLEQLRFGLELDGRPLKHAQVSWQNEHQLRFVLKEGRKRQIRRMCELVGLKVVGLKRVRMGRITLSKLPVGQWRFLRPDERF